MAYTKQEIISWIAKDVATDNDDAINNKGLSVGDLYNTPVGEVKKVKGPLTNAVLFEMEVHSTGNFIPVDLFPFSDPIGFELANGTSGSAFGNPYLKVYDASIVPVYNENTFETNPKLIVRGEGPSSSPQNFLDWNDINFGYIDYTKGNVRLLRSETVTTITDEIIALINNEMTLNNNTTHAIALVIDLPNLSNVFTSGPTITNDINPDGGNYVLLKIPESLSTNTYIEALIAKGATTEYYT